ncbi:hypothetical protein D9613_011744 [Agrocybe pediades]|uniref:DUF6534 domain-containing protein n=1 Tax=Agrocybe pediades TaxID=84607 RepID=A0A8H4VK46_9AGAR|nr:hypothetical protein D9613_011744 [Agrocybe pediades]
MSVPSTRTLNFGLPKFDSTLGALYIGSSVATILYGCRGQALATNIRLADISRPIKQVHDSVLSTAEQAMMMAGIYRVLVTDFLNPLALLAGGPGDGVFIYVGFAFPRAQTAGLTLVDSPQCQLTVCEGVYQCLAPVVFLLAYMGCHCFQLQPKVATRFYSAHGGSSPERNGTSDFILLSPPGSYIDLAVNGFTQESPDGNTPGFILAFKLGTSAQVAYDVIVTTAMTWSLQRSRMGIKRKDHAIRIITLFTTNTNLITILFAIGGLVTFLTLPRATVYAGIEFILGKTNFNSFLAMLNARDYLREMFDNAGNTSTAYPQFHNAAHKGESGETTPGPHDGASLTLPDMSFSPGKSATTTV